MNYGLENGVICEPAQVIMHLPENWTKILFVRTYGVGLADGGIYWDIPTELIPPDLRSFGSRFVVRARTAASGPPLLHPLHGRESRYEDIKIERLPDADKNLWRDCNNPTKSV